VRWLCDGSGFGRNGFQELAADPQLRLAHLAPDARVDDRRDVRRRARLDDRLQRCYASKRDTSATRDRGQDR
jgi:hypothetical protein